MKTTDKKSITVGTTVNAPVERVWTYWSTPEHIKNWYHASDDWHAPHAENDLSINGKFKITMAARDDSAKFDFEGIYTHIELNKFIAFIMLDGRKANIFFNATEDKTEIAETFEAENVNSIELQKDGWQAILDKFKRYVESAGKMEMLHFEIAIKAPAEKVYKTMIDKDYYVQWTSGFAAGSHYKGSWNKGSKITFLAPGENGKSSGMVSRIKENIPSKFISIEHVAVVRDGKETSGSKESESWAGARENYTFIEQKGNTLLCIDTDSLKEYKDIFLNAWPKALVKLKKLCEK
jgi:uncharacterized protein YndB with AHSA1/START domain